MTLNIVGGTRSIGDEDLRLWLKGHIDGHPHLTTVELSRSGHIGYQKTALEAYLKGTYFLPEEHGGMGVNPQNSRLEARIRAYREKIEGTVRHGYQNNFIETRSWQQLQHAVNTAITENVIVIVYAKPGVGKTRCLGEYVIEKMTTSPVRILCSSIITTTHFVKKIAQQIGVRDTMTTSEVLDLIVERFRKQPRPLIVDQANYLNEKALGAISYIWDEARIPVVMIGTHDLKDLFTKSDLTENVRVQLSSRVAMHYPLNELSSEEVLTIVKKVLGDRATPNVVAEIMNATHGNHRHLDFLLPRVAAAIEKNSDAFDNGQYPVEKVIRTAAAKLFIG